MRLRRALTATALGLLLLLAGCQGSTATGSDNVQAPANEVEGGQPMPNTGRQDDQTLQQDPDAGGGDTTDTGGARDFQGEDPGAPGG